VVEVGVSFSTIANNEALARGGGLGVFNGSIQLNHSIVADNTAPEGPDIGAGLVPLRYSLVENSSGFTPDSTFGILGTDPLLGPLADNGGPTQTHALMMGSIAIDNGELGVSAPAFDQRGSGFDRIIDGNGDTFAVIDMGAFEYNPNPAILAGDYNNDQVVNLADYTVWRDALGSLIALPNEDPLATPGEVTMEDYQVWKANFGQSLPAVVSAPAAASSQADSQIDESNMATDSAFAVYESTNVSQRTTQPRRTGVAPAAPDATDQLALLLLDRVAPTIEAETSEDNSPESASGDTSLELALAIEWDEA
jgi:hypothetical protein